MSEKVRNCKVCQGKAKGQSGSDPENEWYWFACAGTDIEEDCGYQSDAMPSYEEAVKACNTRPIEDALRAENEALRERVDKLEKLLIEACDPGDINQPIEIAKEQRGV